MEWNGTITTSDGKFYLNKKSSQFATGNAIVQVEKVNVICVTYISNMNDSNDE